MKKTTIAIAVGVIFVVGAVIAFAQMSHKGGISGHHSEDSAGHQEKFIEHISGKLNFTEQQKTRAKQILADSKPRLDQLHKQLKESHLTMMNSTTSGVFDEQKVHESAGRDTPKPSGR